MTSNAAHDPREEAQLREIQESYARTDPAAVADLVEKLGAASWRVRQAAVACLARRGGSQAVEAILRTMRQNHRNLSILNSAIQILSQTGINTGTALQELLRGSDHELRVYAAMVLGEQNNLQAVPGLMAALDDSDSNVRYHAIEALGKLQASAASEALAAVAESREFSLAFPALTALALIGDRRVAHRLLPLLEDRFLQPAVIETLGEIGNEEAVSTLAALVNQPDAPSGAIARALADIHRRFETDVGAGRYIADLARRAITRAGVTHLIAALDQATGAELPGIVAVLGWLDGSDVDAALSALFGNAAVRDAVGEVLVRRGAASIPGLIEHLGSEDLATRRTAALSLGRIGNKTAVPALLAALADDNSLTVTIAGSLAMIGDGSAYVPLVGLLGHSSAAVRHAAVSALNAIGHPDLSADLVRLLRDSNPLIRESAVKVAGYFAFPPCRDLLLECCRDPEENVRRAAVECLPILEDPRASAALTAALSDPAASVRGAAARIAGQVSGADAAGPLRKALQDPDPWVRYYAARSIGRAGAVEALGALADLAAGDVAMQVRIAAVQAMGSMGSTEITVLETLAESRFEDLARAALDALASVGAWGPLVAAVQSGDSARRIQALQSLGRCRRPEVVATLRAAAAGPDLDEAQAAIEALGESALPAAIEVLIDLTAVPRWRELCVSKLAGVGEENVAWVAQGLRHEQVDVRRSVVAALGRMRCPAAMSALQTAAEDAEPAVRFAAIRAIAHLGTSAGASAGER